MRNRVSWLSCGLALALGLAAPHRATSQEPPAQEQTPAVELAAASESYTQALRLYRSRNFEAALEALNQVAKAEPDRPDVHYLIGYCHLMLRRYPDSLDAFSRAFHEDPRFDPRTIYQKPKSP